MKCYNHNEIDAVGICKNCNKGLCTSCNTELTNGIACTSTCIEEVNQINLLIQKSKVSHKTAIGVYMRSAYVTFTFGIIFLFYGIFTETASSFLLSLGIIFIIASIFSFVSAKKYKKIV